MNFRIGEGWDVHALVPGRKLILGGVEVPHTLGLLDALQSKRATDDGLVTTQPHPVAGNVNVLAPPYRFDGERLPDGKGFVLHIEPMQGELSGNTEADVQLINDNV